MSAKGTRAIDELRQLGLPHEVHEYAVHAATRRDHRTKPAYGLEAATALGVDSRRVFKTLLAELDGQLVVAIVPVADELDLKRLAEALGGRRATMAEPAAAERVTGYVVRGISPLSQRRSHPTVLDVSAGDHDTILVSAGRRGLQIELRPGDLTSITSATVAPIARRR